MAATFTARLIVDDVEQGAGVLTLGETFAWTPSAAASSKRAAVEAEYPLLVLHAVCTDPESFPEPCVYIQLESGAEWRLVPESVDAVQSIFAELCKQSALHPGDDAADNGDAEMFDSSSSARMDVMLQRLGDMIEAEPGRFDDPDEGEQQAGAARKSQRVV